MCIFCSIDILRQYGELIGALETKRFMLATIKRFNLKVDADEMKRINSEIEKTQQSQAETRAHLQTAFEDIGLPECAKVLSFFFDAFTKESSERLRANEAFVASQIDVAKRMGLFDRIAGFKFIHAE